ncbi:HNH endonuclease [Candidatus Peregrinibacteria bacterium]|nr:HNH endonuclease [Candidatus Peregrinibacteria bacterium]
MSDTSVPINFPVDFERFSGNIRLTSGGTVDFEKLTDKDLYKYCKTTGLNARIWNRRFIAALPEVAKRRLYKKYGYCSIHEFAAKLAGVSHNNVDGVLRIDEKFKQMPKMRTLIGEVGLSKLKIVACIATKETDSFWAEKVKNMTKSSLEIYLKEMRMEWRRKSSTENYNNVISAVNNTNNRTISDQGLQFRLAEKFPGELSAENTKMTQEQRQIGLFASEKSILQNRDMSILAGKEFNDFNSHSNLCLHPRNKKPFTIQIDKETEFELRKFKQQLEKEKKEPLDWNTTLKEMVKRAAANKSPQPYCKRKSANKKWRSTKSVSAFSVQKATESASASDPRTKPEKLTSKSWPTVVSRHIPAKSRRELEHALSRHIPVKSRYNLEQKYNGRCAYPGCNKPAEQIHHKDGFSITKNHENLMPLCKAHHDFAHMSAVKPILNAINKNYKRFKSEQFASVRCGPKNAA